MSIFGLIKSDDKVFTGDKLFIDVSKSFLSPGLSFATVSHEISMDSGVTWINVTSTKNISWIFTTSGAKTIQLRVSTTEPANEVFTKSINCVNLTTQALFSNDSDLYGYESEIDQYLPKKWSSWNLIHLKAQEWIMDWLDEKRVLNQDGEKYVVADLLDTVQVKQLSCAKTLELIYESNINIPDDLFTKKRDKYREMVQEKASKARLVLDFNKDGIANDGEVTDLLSVTMLRR